MSFTSLDFAIFLPIVFLLFWSMNPYSLKIQNGLLLVASAVHGYELEKQHLSQEYSAILGIKFDFLLEC